MKKSVKSISSTVNGVFNDKMLFTGIQERIVSLVGRKNQWQGTMTDLMKALRSIGGKTKITFPTSPSVLRRVVNNVIYTLRKSGVKTAFTRTSDHMRTRLVEFTSR